MSLRRSEMTNIGQASPAFRGIQLKSDSQINYNVNCLLKAQRSGNIPADHNQPTAYENAAYESLNKIPKRHHQKTSINESFAKQSNELHIRQMEKLVNLQGQMETKVFKIMRKREDVNKRKRIKQRMLGAFKGEPTNCKGASKKISMAREIMEEMRSKAKAKQEHEKISDSFWQSLQEASSRNTTVEDTFDQGQEQDLDKKMHRFQKKLNKMTFDQLYQEQRRNATQQAFLKATRGFNVNDMDDIEDINRPTSSGKKRPTPANKTQQMKVDQDNEKQNSIWQASNAFRYYLTGKFIQSQGATSPNIRLSCNI